METTTSSPQTKPNVWSLGAKGGLITGLVLFLFTFVFQFLLGFFAEWWMSIIPILGFIIGIVMTHKTFKKDGNGLMSYGEGLFLAVVLGAVAGIVVGLLTFAYVNLIDPTIPEKQADAVADLQIRMLERFGASDADIDEAYDKAEEQKEAIIEASRNPLKTIGYQLLGGIGYSFFLALIITIFTRKKNPEYEY